MNRRSFLKMLSSLPLVLPFASKVELPKGYPTDAEPVKFDTAQYALVEDDEIVLDGSFTANTTNKISTWHGTSWNGLATGNDDLYVSGEFAPFHKGDIMRSNSSILFVYDGNAWQELKP